MTERKPPTVEELTASDPGLTGYVDGEVARLHRIEAAARRAHDTLIDIADGDGQEWRGRVTGATVALRRALEE